MIAVDIKATHTFTLPGDDTVFQLGLFDTALRNHFNKILGKAQTTKKSDDGKVETEIEGDVAAQYMLDLVRYGLRGWDLKDPDGKDVPFKTEQNQLAGVPGPRPAVTFATLDYLPQTAITKLGEAIGNLNLTSEKQGKNSPPPSA